MTDYNNENGSVEPNARDGFRVKTFEETVGDSISLWLEFMQDGIPQEAYSCMLRRWKDDTLKNSGERQRMLAVCTAMARFVNLGGDADDLHAVVACLIATGVAPDWGARGWHILDTKQEPGDTPEVIHYFVNEAGDKVLVWTEDSSVEVISMDELNQELDADASEDISDREGPSIAGQDPRGPARRAISGPRAAG